MLVMTIDFLLRHFPVPADRRDGAARGDVPTTVAGRGEQGSFLIQPYAPHVAEELWGLSEARLAAGSTRGPRRIQRLDRP